METMRRLHYMKVRKFIVAVRGSASNYCLSLRFVQKLTWARNKLMHEMVFPSSNYIK